MNLNEIRKIFTGKEIVRENLKKVDNLVNYDLKEDDSKMVLRFQGADGDILSTAELLVSNNHIFNIKPLKCAWQDFSSPRRVEYKRAYATETRYGEYYDVLKVITKP